MSRLGITTQFRDDIATKRACIEQTLFVDEHAEFCVLGFGNHHGGNSRFEWRAHRDADGNICREADGGVLDAPVPRPRAKNPARADGIFGVCAPIPRGGRRQEGRRMRPCRYRGKVVGVLHYAAALAAEIERVRKLGLRNREKVADPTQNSRPGVWFDHVDPGKNPYEVSIATASPFYSQRSNIEMLLSCCSHDLDQTGGTTSRPSSAWFPSWSSLTMSSLRGIVCSQTRSTETRG